MQANPLELTSLVRTWAAPDAVYDNSTLLRRAGEDWKEIVQSKGFIDFRRESGNAPLDRVAIYDGHLYVHFQGRKRDEGWSEVRDSRDSQTIQFRTQAIFRMATDCRNAPSSSSSSSSSSSAPVQHFSPPSSPHRPFGPRDNLRPVGGTLRGAGDDRALASRALPLRADDQSDRITALERDLRETREELRQLRQDQLDDTKAENRQLKRELSEARGALNEQAAQSRTHEDALRTEFGQANERALEAREASLKRELTNLNEQHQAALKAQEQVHTHLSEENARLREEVELERGKLEYLRADLSEQAETRVRAAEAKGERNLAEQKALLESHLATQKQMIGLLAKLVFKLLGRENQYQSQLEALRQENVDLKNELEAEQEVSEARLAQLNRQAEAHLREIEGLHGQINGLQGQNERLEGQLSEFNAKHLRQRNHVIKLKAQIGELQAEQAALVEQRAKDRIELDTMNRLRKLLREQLQANERAKQSLGALVQLERQLRELQETSKAEQAKSAAEIARLHDELRRAQSAVPSLQEKIKELQTSSSADQSNYAAQMAQLTAELHAARDAVPPLQARIQELEETSSAEKAESAAEIAQLQDELSQAQSDLPPLTERISELERENSRLVTEVEQLERKIAQLESTSAASSAQSLASDQALAAMRTELARAQEQLAEQDRQIAALEVQKGDAEKAARASEKETAALRSQLQQANSELQEMAGLRAELETQRAETTRYQRQVAQLQGKLATAMKIVGTSRQIITQLRIERQEVEALSRKHEENINELGRMLIEEKIKVRQLETELAEVKKKADENSQLSKLQGALRRAEKIQRALGGEVPIYLNADSYRRVRAVKRLLEPGAVTCETKKGGKGVNLETSVENQRAWYKDASLHQQTPQNEIKPISNNKKAYGSHPEAHQLINIRERVNNGVNGNLLRQLKVEFNTLLNLFRTLDQTFAVNNDAKLDRLIANKEQLEKSGGDTRECCEQIARLHPLYQLSNLLAGGAGNDRPMIAAHILTIKFLLEQCSGVIKDNVSITEGTTIGQFRSAFGALELLIPTLYNNTDLVPPEGISPRGAA